MQSRTILINLDDNDWFRKAIFSANEILKHPYIPSKKLYTFLIEENLSRAIVELLDK